MKQMRTIDVPAKTREVVDRTTCDMCGGTIAPGENDAEEVSISHKRGFTCRDGGNGTETTIDLCGTCFDRRLIPWLESNGVKPLTENWDW